MNKTEAIQILAVLKAAYPNSYKNITMEEAQGVATLWTTHFSSIPVDIVLIAVNKLIASSVFPPTIADVKNKLDTMYCEAVSAIATDNALTQQQIDNLRRISQVCRYAPREPEIQSFFNDDNIKKIEGAK